MSAVFDFVSWASNKVAPTQPTRRYEAASHSPRMKHWYTPVTDGTSAIQDPQTIRDRARSLVRDNPWAAKGLNSLVSNSIGFGIRCQIHCKSKTRMAQAQRLWEQWAETSACDADGIGDLYHLQALAMRAMVESGEVLIRLRPRRPEDRLPVPIQLQVIECDMIADTLQLDQQLANGNTVLRGIEFDTLGRRVAYYLRKRHPGSPLAYLNPADYVRVPADEIIHLFRKDRPGQERGVSWFAPVTVTLKELAQYEDAYLVRQKLANLMCGFLISDNPNDFEDELATELPDLSPGTMYALRPGSQIEFNTPPPAGEDPAYRDSCLRRVAAGLGVTYESLTGDLSSVNFSSARMGAQEMGRAIDGYLWQLFIPRFCNRVFQWFLDAAELQTGLITTDITAEWTPPARTIVDPSKEFQSLASAVRNGFITLPEAIRRQGYDPVAVATEQAEYLAILDGLGIKVESDYRNDSKVAVAEAAPQEDDSPTADADDTTQPGAIDAGD
jgi:lambda family phage portal protein